MKNLLYHWKTCTVPNIWIRPNNQRKEADAAKTLLTIAGGDHLTLMNVYNHYQQSMFIKIIVEQDATHHTDLQTSSIGIGRTWITYLAVPCNKRRMSGHNLSALWSTMESSLCLLRTNKSCYRVFRSRSYVDSSCKLRIENASSYMSSSRIIKWVTVYFAYVRPMCRWCFFRLSASTPLVVSIVSQNG